MIEMENQEKEIGIKEIENLLEQYRKKCEYLAKSFELEFLGLRYTYTHGSWRFSADFKYGETKITIPILFLIKTIKVVEVFKVVEAIDDIEKELKDVLRGLVR
jgi:hypothetical protein